MYTNRAGGLGLSYGSAYSSLPPLTGQEPLFDAPARGFLASQAGPFAQWIAGQPVDPGYPLHGEVIYWNDRVVPLGFTPRTWEGFVTYQGWRNVGSPRTLEEMPGSPWEQLGRDHPDFLGWYQAQIAAAFAIANNINPSQQAANWQNAARDNAARGWWPFPVEPVIAAFDAAFPEALEYAAEVRGVPAPAPPAAGDLIANPVTGILIPRADVLYMGPLPGVPGRWSFATTAGAYTIEGDYTGEVIGSPTQDVLDAAAYFTRLAAQTAAAVPVLSMAYDVVAFTRDMDPARFFAISDPSLYKPGFWRTHERLADGSERVSPWTYNGFASWLTWDAWTDPALKTQLWGDTELLSFRRWEDLSAGEQLTINAEVGAIPATVGTPATVTLPTGEQVPIEQAPPGTFGPAPITPVTEPAPVLYPSTAPALPPSSAIPATTTPTPGPAPSLAPLPSGPIYAIPGGGYPSPAMPAAEPAAPVVQEAGIGKGLLIGGGILAAVLLLGGRRRRRPSIKGYRRY